MSKIYHYDANIDLKKKEETKVAIDLEIRNVKFLVPISVEYDIRDVESNEVLHTLSQQGSINMAEQEIFFDNVTPEIYQLLRTKVFEYLRESSILPDSYELDEETMNKVEQTRKEYQDICNDNIER